jgi:hypothetical protein
MANSYPWLISGLAVCAFLASGCAPEAAPVATPDPAPVQPAPPTFELAEPTVAMEATPQPPFTYWAPEGATIRNHPNVPGMWLAFVGGQNVATYVGDACRASAYQRFVGQSADALPAPQDGVDVRLSCEGCAVNGDLRPNRMNLVFDEETRVITRIACF